MKQQIQGGKNIPLMLWTSKWINKKDNLPLKDDDIWPRGPSKMAGQLKFWVTDQKDGDQCWALEQDPWPSLLQEHRIMADPVL